MYISEFCAGEGKYHVQLHVYETCGKGLCCVVTGGECAHIGGAAACFGDGAGSVLESVSFPHHKDAVLARQLALRLFQGMEQDVVVAAGIHIDDATKDEIKILCDNAFETVEAYLKR